MVDYTLSIGKHPKRHNYYYINIDPALAANLGLSTTYTRPTFSSITNLAIDLAGIEAKLFDNVKGISRGSSFDSHSNLSREKQEVFVGIQKLISRKPEKAKAPTELVQFLRV